MTTKSIGGSWAVFLTLIAIFNRPVEAAQSVTLGWNPSPAAGVAGYQVYYGNDGTNFQEVIDTGTNTSCQVSDLPEGQTITFAVASYNTQGIESPPSNLISYIVPGLVKITPKAGPGSPTVINFPVSPGHTYQVQASVDLATWFTIFRTTASNNAWIQVQDAESATLQRRFYRVVWQ